MNRDQMKDQGLRASLSGARSDLPKRGSTWRFQKEARNTPGYSFCDFLHGYFYARWPYLYISIGLGEHPLAKAYRGLVSRLQRLGLMRPTDGRPKGSVADSYHGKVMPTEAARRLVMVKENLNVPDLEQIIPYPKARSLILENPDHIAVLDCPCRSAREEPCLPLDVCLIIGEPFAGFVIEHHPEKARWISAEEASKILTAEHDRGHVHHAFFKDAMLNRFYAICNCCECCCGAMQAQRMGSPMLASSGYVASVNTELCIDCGDCESQCPFHAVVMGDCGYQIDRSACMGCGICVDVCSQEALQLILAPDRGIPLVIEALLNRQ